MEDAPAAASSLGIEGFVGIVVVLRRNGILAPLSDVGGLVGQPEVQSFSTVTEQADMQPMDAVIPGYGSRVSIAERNDVLKRARNGSPRSGPRHRSRYPSTPGCS